MKVSYHIPICRLCFIKMYFKLNAEVVLTPSHVHPLVLGLQFQVTPF